MKKGSAAAKPLATIVPSSPEPIQLGLLRRAPENVRHTRVDEDVETLADDITAHGLLSSLIGYRSDWPEDADRVFVVGGGRRLQALQLLYERGAVDDRFPVPVLIRDAELAVELSLAENLQQRTMSPVDEFVAFKALIDTGHHSPASLAKRFGFTERLVKQRLRLAELAEPVLQGLADREITLDAAMAYATTQDKDRQAKVYTSHRKGAGSTWSHQPSHIRGDLAKSSMDTDDPLFRFVGADSYEKSGGEYEDDLFTPVGEKKMLLTPSILKDLAQAWADHRAADLIATLRENSAWSPSIEGYVLVPGLRFESWGANVKPTAPNGYVLVDTWRSDRVWNTIRNNRIAARVVVGIDPKGELIAWPRWILVDAEQRQAVDPTVHHVAGPVETSEQRAARERAAAVDTLARRLAIGPFAGSRWQGRAYWPDRWQAREQRDRKDGVDGWLVPVTIFVSDVEVAAQATAAEREYVAQLAAAADADSRAEARAAELEAMDPPAVVVIEGDVWIREEDGGYVTDDGEGFVDSWLDLIANYDAADVTETYASRDDWSQNTGAATSTDPANDDATTPAAEAAE
ncbi:ParB/RepB/Spo0J family partition protein [uncultured Sphingomonas sp.]|uniref:ParB/RepB/Spo0J family partition protein n=1 Tax=uncultured Sphingomonas sp. TaxID=158754 RepID=UPI00260E6C25|nr:ParB/RepB/Spo0J family partition protein [uncultured Sphingomonas sp.]